MTLSEMAQVSTDALRARRGELATWAQMAAVESLPIGEEMLGELSALDAELERRGVDLSAG